MRKTNNRIHLAVKNESGVENLITASVAIVFAMVMVALTISVWSSVVTKWNLDQAVDQLTRRIELAGVVDDDTSAMEQFLLDQLHCDGVSLNITCTYVTAEGGDKCIQLGTPFYLYAEAQSHIGGFGDFLRREITYKSQSSGVSEKYWKDAVES